MTLGGFPFNGIETKSGDIDRLLSTLKFRIVEIKKHRFAVSMELRAVLLHAIEIDRLPEAVAIYFWFYTDSTGHSELFDVDLSGTISSSQKEKIINVLSSVDCDFVQKYVLEPTRKKITSGYITNEEVNDRRQIIEKLLSTEQNQEKKSLYLDVGKIVDQHKRVSKSVSAIELAVDPDWIQKFSYRNASKLQGSAFVKDTLNTFRVIVLKYEEMRILNILEKEIVANEVWKTIVRLYAFVPLQENKKAYYHVRLALEKKKPLTILRSLLNEEM